MAAFQAKRYADRAIQTECTGLCIQTKTDPSVHGKTALSRECICSPGDSLKEHEITEDVLGERFSSLVISAEDEDASAYTQCQNSELSANRNPPTSKASKQRITGSGRPSEQASPVKRIVSLPNASTVTDDLTISERQTRIVSMPEHSSLLRLKEEKRISLETGNTSGSSGVNSAQGLTRLKLETRRVYPLDLPQTPSPPSSPESVMIIGNESQVSGSFLRRPYTDDEGWITWASSPPRPIPALHGPLSLPYARCPSGAEGTVIEGDDLSNKIWGLGIQDETLSTRVSKTQQSQPNRHHVSARSPAGFPRPLNQELDGFDRSPFQGGRDSVIDLSKPISFRNPRNLSRGTHNHLSDLDQHGMHSVVRDNPAAFMTAKSTRSRHPHGGPGLVDTRSHQQVGSNPIISPGNERFSSSRGLGLNWNGDFLASPLSLPGTTPRIISHKGSHLNTSAPAFVPALSNRHKTVPVHAYTQPLTNVALTHRQHELHLGTSATVQNTPLVEYPDTPSTASPRFSPMFVQPINAAKTNKNISTRHHQDLVYQATNVYSPHIELDDYANKLRMMIDQLRGNDFNCNSPRFPPIDGFPGQKITQFQPVMAVGKGTIVQERNDEPRAPGGDSSAPGLILGPETTEKNTNLLEPDNFSFPSERRRNLSYQHPRSIPLARLIQRRLSSVPEEDAVRDSLLPLLHKIKRNAASSQDRDEIIQSQVIEHMDSEEKIVSVEESMMYPEELGAVVNLPKKATAASSGEGKGPRHLRHGALGGRKETAKGISTQTVDNTVSGKQKNRQ